MADIVMGLIKLLENQYHLFNVLRIRYCIPTTMLKFKNSIVLRQTNWIPTLNGKKAQT